MFALCRTQENTNLCFVRDGVKNVWQEPCLVVIPAHDALETCGTILSSLGDYAHSVRNGSVEAQLIPAAHVPIRKSGKPITQHRSSLLSHSNALIVSQLGKSGERG